MSLFWYDEWMKTVNNSYDVIKDELAKPVEDMWSTEELRNFFIELDEIHTNTRVFEPALNHPNMTAELVEELCQLWPKEEKYIKFFAINNRVDFSDELVEYISLFKHREIWEVLVNKFSYEMFTKEQVKFLWGNAPAYFKMRIVEFSLAYEFNRKINLPAIAWVQYYVLHSTSFLVKINLGNVNLDEALGGSNGLRSLFIEYLKDLNEDNLDLSNLPLEWLTELVIAHVSLDDYYNNLKNLNNE